MMINVQLWTIFSVFVLASASNLLSVRLLHPREQNQKEASAFYDILQATCSDTNFVPAPSTATQFPAQLAAVCEFATIRTG